MMGGHHAVTGAAAWVAVTATAPMVPALHLMSLTPAETALGAVLAAGAALGPDADHPQATVAHSGGIASKAATGFVGAVAGGHRHGTHAPIVALAICVAAWFCNAHHLIAPVRFDPSWWVAGAVICALMAFSVKVLRLTHRWPTAWLIGAVTAAAILFLWPAFVPLLPPIIALGWCVHLVGDILTTGGLPMFWPLRVPGPSVVPDAIWGGNGYVALPVLGNAGSMREWLLCIPISAYALFGFGASLYVLLPSA